MAGPLYTIGQRVQVLDEKGNIEIEDTVITNRGTLEAGSEITDAEESFNITTAGVTYLYKTPDCEPVLESDWYPEFCIKPYPDHDSKCKSSDKEKQLLTI